MRNENFMVDNGQHVSHIRYMARGCNDHDHSWPIIVVTDQVGTSQPSHRRL